MKKVIHFSFFLLLFVEFEFLESDRLICILKKSIITKLDCRSGIIPAPSQLPTEAKLPPPKSRLPKSQLC